MITKRMGAKPRRPLHQSHTRRSITQTTRQTASSKHTDDTQPSASTNGQLELKKTQKRFYRERKKNISLVEVRSKRVNNKNVIKLEKETN